ncbi:hypothetical protein GCM10011400_67320 [Paraburkholderia caffeinilytica]|uniref:Uncharacterized protein n=1 Tax=Paraburkholderia caffeinilytica TaxID=1761016 RepID=A0ABQ1NCB4_9BURK|nr:hypothetical protein GCM10011400_67320 [Paraburkholderia caffeinilytica]
MHGSAIKALNAAAEEAWKVPRSWAIPTTKTREYTAFAPNAKNLSQRRDLARKAQMARANGAIANE